MCAIPFFWGIWHCLVLILFGYLFFVASYDLRLFYFALLGWDFWGPAPLKKLALPHLDFVWSPFFCGQSCAVPFVYLKLPASEIWGHEISEIFF